MKSDYIGGGRGAASLYKSGDNDFPEENQYIPHVAKRLREAFSTSTTAASLHLRLIEMFPNVNFNEGYWTNAS